MAQEKLTQALDILKRLESQLDGELLAQLQQAKHMIQAAHDTGEGRDADELREMIGAEKVKNSEFVSVMVHEVRKPMTSIRGYSDILNTQQMGPLNEMQAQFVGTIRNNIISMERLISDISDISKLRSGRMVPEAKMEMFKNIVMKLEKDLPEEAAARQVELNFEVPQGLPLLNTDSQRVEQALRKIIENAIRYTEEGEGKITVVAEGLGDRLRVTVQDNGVGLSEDDKTHLGELFYRGDNDLVMQTKGYGMGIPIAMECMDLIGGEFFWESEAGVGSTFGIVLPAMT